MGSLGNDFILPPMLPERSTDIARKDNVFKNHAIQSPTFRACCGAITRNYRRAEGAGVRAWAAVRRR